MKASKKKRLEELSNEVGRAWRLADEGKNGESLEVLLKVVADLQALGTRSAFALWHVAMVSERTGELEMAFDYITQALEEDPLASPLRNSFDVITRRMRESLADAARPAGDPSTPRLYGLLVRSGEADLGAHLAMARWCTATGDHGRARALSEAMTTLYPLDRSAWLCAAEAARATGDLELAGRATAEAAALDGPPAPFLLQGVACG